MCCPRLIDRIDQAAKVSERRDGAARAAVLDAIVELDDARYLFLLGHVMLAQAIEKSARILRRLLVDTAFRQFFFFFRNVILMDRRTTD